MLERSEALAVATHLGSFLQLFDELIDLLADRRPLSPPERAKVKEQLRYLKDQLKLAAKRRPANKAEKLYFSSAVQKAAANLTAAGKIVGVQCCDVWGHNSFWGELAD